MVHGPGDPVSVEPALSDEIGADSTSAPVASKTVSEALPSDRLVDQYAVAVVPEFCQT